MTQRAFWVGAVGLCLYLISVIHALPPAFSLLSWMALTLLISCGALTLLSLQGVACRFRLVRAVGEAAWPNNAEHEDENAEREPPEYSGPQVEVALRNAGTLNKTNLILTLILEPQHQTPSPKSRRKNRMVQKQFAVEALPSGEDLNAILALNDLPRGLYELREVRITGSDVLGLFRATTRFRAEAVGDGVLKIVAAPASVSTQGAISGSSEGSGRRNLRHSADEFVGARPYVIGDSVRNVHWKTTARRGQLMVRERESLAQTRALLVWDAALPASEYSGKRDETHPETEQSLRLIMSLCAYFAASRTDCVLLLDGAKPQRIGSREGAFLARCGAALAEAQPDKAVSESGAALTPLFNGNTRGDRVFIVSQRADESLLALSARWRAMASSITLALVEPPSTQGDDLVQLATQLRANGVRLVLVPSQGNARENLQKALAHLLDETTAARRTLSTQRNATPETAPNAAPENAEVMT